MGSRLKDVTTGDSFRIDSVPDADLRARLLRLGFLNETVRCLYRARKGPIVIARGGTKLALGRSVAETIGVAEVGER